MTRPLVLCAGTIPRASFRERIAAARAGGFDAVSLRVGDRARAHAEGLDDERLRGLLADAGLWVSEIEALTAWRPGVVPGGRTPSEADVFAVAVATGARGVSVVEGPGAPLAVGPAAEAFAALCDRAAARGLRVHVEVWPGSGLDLPTTAAVVAAAGRTNGGLMLDTWHLARTTGGADLLRALPGTVVTAIQVSDSPPLAEPATDYLRAAMHDRLLPGEGTLDLAAVVRWLDASGSAASLGVEVCSDALASLPPAVVGERAGAAIRSVVRAALRG